MQQVNLPPPNPPPGRSHAPFDPPPREPLWCPLRGRRGPPQRPPQPRCHQWGWGCWRGPPRPARPRCGWGCWRGPPRPARPRWGWGRRGPPRPAPGPAVCAGPGGGGWWGGERQCGGWGVQLQSAERWERGLRRLEREFMAARWLAQAAADRTAAHLLGGRSPALDILCGCGVDLLGGLGRGGRSGPGGVGRRVGLALLLQVTLTRG